ncbi:hypothetical protein ACQ4PT_045484 [Festuca glaucescens]
MRLILMKGHELPLTFLKYNRDGDLLFSCAKDHTPTVWYADNGDRLGTYHGHNGAVWSCDVSHYSTRLITGSADQTAKLWDVKTGRELFTFRFDAPRALRRLRHRRPPRGHHHRQLHGEHAHRAETDESALVISGITGRINRAVWGPGNRTIITAGEDATIRVWDSETGKLLKESDKEEGHQKAISSLSKSSDWSHFLTGSLDKSAKVVIGGGQDAMNVTMTDRRAGKFEAKFFHKILQEEIGGVKGHFGPINALAFNPDGRRFMAIYAILSL